MKIVVLGMGVMGLYITLLLAKSIEARLKLAQKAVFPVFFINCLLHKTNTILKELLIVLDGLLINHGAEREVLAIKRAKATIVKFIITELNKSNFDCS